MTRASSSSLRVLLFFPLFIFLQLPRATVALCWTATRAECRRQQTFVPGWKLAGEGVDVTTLRRTGYFPVNVNRFMRPDGTCTLCQNDMQDNQVQRLPLAITDWQSHSGHCERNVVKTEANSVVEVAANAAKKIKNDWKADLEVKYHLNKGQIALAASHSEAARFASEKSHKDKYSFAMESVQCRYYRFHLVEKPPLSQDFVQAIKALPLKFNASTNADYHRFITKYGTHFLKSVELGGRVTDITALRTCELALDGLKAKEVGACLSVEASVSLGNVVATSDVKKCNDEMKNHHIKGSFHSTYSERKVEVEGGQVKGSTTDLLFSDQEGKKKFSQWMDTLPSKPGLLAYTLEPLHFLLGSKNPWREELRQAVSHYVTSRARWQDCSKPCPPGQKKNPTDPCQCVCQASPFTNGDCCPRERGLAHVEVFSISANDLWGDYSTGTDGYIKAFFGKKELRTPVVWNNNNPRWNTRLDFGTVQLVTAYPLRMQVWDADDGWDDDLLGSCDRMPEAGERWEQCHFSYGHLYFHYRVTCAPYLTGSNCMEYAPRGALEEPVGNRSGAVW